MIVMTIAGLILVWAIISFIRIEIVYRHIRRRIKEVYKSPQWHKYEIDIVGTYNLAFWNYRKWTYRDFFPEVVE